MCVVISIGKIIAVVTQRVKVRRPLVFVFFYTGPCGGKISKHYS